MSKLDEIIVNGAAMYRRMAQQALETAGKTEDETLCEEYRQAAAHWAGLADDTERFAASIEVVSSKAVG